MDKCPICSMPTEVEDASPSQFALNCFRCGAFSITREADAILRHSQLTGPEVANSSGFIRRNAGLLITTSELDRLRSLQTPSVTEKATSLLLVLASDFPQPAILFSDPAAVCAETIHRLTPFQTVPQYPNEAIDQKTEWLKFLSIASAANAAELRWLIHKLLIPHGYLEANPKQEIIGTSAYHLLTITPSGWEHVGSSKTRNTGSRVGFIAMSFRPEFLSLYDEGIAPGVASAGYEPVRVDRKEHNNRIDDEIIATIKVSRFLIADFTVDRGGIYFEAGYALGLGLPVIWLVRETEKDSIHFDTRQYNFIRWAPDDFVSLKNALKHRIEATIGRGPAAS